MKPLPVVAVALMVIGGCTSPDEVTAIGTAPTTAALSTTLTSVDGEAFAVEPLGLTFRLPDSFRSVDDRDYLFFARSIAPRSLFTIDSDSPSTTDHAQEPGETLSEHYLGDVRAVVVTDAVLEGMPSGVSSNELLVSNGDRSFSVIMSAPSADLPELWDVFLNSVSVTPAD